MTEKLTDEALEKMAWCDPVAAELLDARKVLEAHRRATPADDLRALNEVFHRWSSGHGFNEDCDEDVDLRDRAALAQKGDA